MATSLQAEQWHPWVADYYRENTACTVASIQNVDSSKDSVQVFLEIEPGTASGLVSSEQSSKDNWFALHCPAETHRAWRENPKTFDVLISADLRPGQAYTLSCADYFQQQRASFKRVNNTVLDKIKALLARKLKANEGDR